MTTAARPVAIPSTHRHSLLGFIVADLSVFQLPVLRRGSIRCVWIHIEVTTISCQQAAGNELTGRTQRSSSSSLHFWISTVIPPLITASCAAITASQPEPYNEIARDFTRVEADQIRTIHGSSTSGEWEGHIGRACAVTVAMLGRYQWFISECK